MTTHQSFHDINNQFSKKVEVKLLIIIKGGMASTYKVRSYKAEKEVGQDSEKTR